MRLSATWSHVAVSASAPTTQVAINATLGGERDQPPSGVFIGQVARLTHPAASIGLRGRRCRCVRAGRSGLIITATGPYSRATYRADGPAAVSDPRSRATLKVCLSGSKATPQARYRARDGLVWG